MISTFYPPFHFGGDAVFLRRLAHALVRRGHVVDVIHDVDAFATLNPGPTPKPLPEPDGLTVHRLRSRLGRFSSLITHQAGRPLVHGRTISRILAKQRHDVIHFHNISLVGGPGILAYGTGIKLYTAHEHWLVCPSHVLWRHNRELCTGRQCLQCVLRHRRPPQWWRYTNLMEQQARHVDAFLSPSEFSADKHREFGFTRRLEVMPYFLPDLDSRFESANPACELDSMHARPFFLFVGRLEKIKGLQDVLPHFQGDGAPDLLIAGEGSYGPDLRRQAADSPRVRFLGRRTLEQLRCLYRSALAVVVPSVCYETFGIVVLEAFRERTPVLARSLGPLGEIVRESGGGLLFSTPDQFGDALDRLASSPSLREQLGSAGYNALRDRWTESSVLPQYFEIIHRCAQERNLTETAIRAARAACCVQTPDSTATDRKGVASWA